MIDAEDIRALLAKASPRPWSRGTGSRLTIWAAGRCIFEDSFRYAELADADLIVAVINAVPEMVETLGRTAAERDAALVQRGQWQAMCGRANQDADEAAALLRDIRDWERGNDTPCLPPSFMRRIASRDATRPTGDKE